MFIGLYKKLVSLIAVVGQKLTIIIFKIQFFYFKSCLSIKSSLSVSELSLP